MEFNPLPEGHEGLQRRRTEFDFPKEKLRYDAKNLLRLSKSVQEAIERIQRSDDSVLMLERHIKMASLPPLRASRSSFALGQIDQAGNPILPEETEAQSLSEPTSHRSSTYTFHSGYVDGNGTPIKEGVVAQEEE